MSVVEWSQNCPVAVWSRCGRGVDTDVTGS